MLYNGGFCYLLLALFLRSISSLSIIQPPELSQRATPITIPDLAANMTSLTNDTTTLTPATGQLTGQYMCTPSSKLRPWTKRPSIRDCGGAIRRLPSSPDIGVFSPEALFPFNIPTEASIQSCKVVISFARKDIQSARSSWTEIGLAAVELALGCIKKGEFTGGNTTTGPQDAIRIDLIYVKGFDPDYATLDTE